jgi:4'-phosphopantetheinyl transferase
LIVLPQVDVFWADLDTAPTLLPRWQALLDRDETARAAHFRYERDRDRYIACHGILRLLLGRYVDRAPPALHFTLTGHGKPVLNGGDLHFNLSHSHHLALFAISRDVSVGCDIELHDERLLAEKQPERFFSPTEIAELHALPPPERLAAFFAGWTRKEAYIKARGVGLSLPLNSFDVSLAPDARPALHRGCEGWSARSIEAAPHCSAAIVAANRAWQMNTQPLDAPMLFTRSFVAA